MNRLSKYVLIPAIVILLTVFAIPVNACYGPHIIGTVDRTEVNMNENVTVTGCICPPADNVTIRVDFTRPDYSYVEQWVLTDNATGAFTVTQKLDMAGFWNIFPIYGHFCDRLYANVTDPAADAKAPPFEFPKLQPYKTNWTVVGVACAAITVGGVFAATGAKNKTRNISSLRLLFQIGVVFLLFFGIFSDHQNLPWPAEQINPHEAVVGTTLLGIQMPDGLSIPAFACYYPCGKTLECPLWQIQAYIYPFWNTGQGWGVNYLMTGAERLAIVFGIIIVASIVLGRWWCGWICPFGLYLDVITRVRKALKIKHRLFSDGFNEKFHQLSYVILAVILVVSVLFGAEALFGTQLIPGAETGGFVYMYYAAPFCAFCPMKPLCVLLEMSVGLMRPEWIFGPTTGIFYSLGYYITSINILILGLVTVAAFYFRRSWCRICPLGGLIGLFNRFPPFKWISGVRLEKREEKCTKCGICKRVCPTQVKEVYEKKGGDVASSGCIMCLRCVEMCPEKDCLKFKVAGKAVFKSRNWLGKTTNNKEPVAGEAA
jgi:ferredoxin-type protein NapH